MYIYSYVFICVFNVLCIFVVVVLLLLFYYEFSGPDRAQAELLTKKKTKVGEGRGGRVRFNNQNSGLCNVELKMKLGLSRRGQSMNDFIAETRQIIPG